MPMEITKPKFNKKICLSCRYCGYGRGSYTVRGKAVFCDYATITNQTCLTRDNKGNVIDLRGTDYNNCQLYASGKTDKTNQFITRNAYERRG